MKLKSLLIAISATFPIALSSQAAVSTLEFVWNMDKRPVPWQSGMQTTIEAVSSSVNPVGGTASSTITGNNITWYTGTRSGYGSQTFTFDTSSSGGFSLNLFGAAMTPAPSITYSLSIVQFVDTALLTGALKLSSTSGTLTQTDYTRTTVEEVTSNRKWVQDTYTWTVTGAAANNANLTILGDTSLGNGELFVDKITWGIVGDLSYVPEFTSTQAFAAAGLLVFSLLAWRRRTVAA